MREWLVVASEHAVIAIDAVALIVIAIGTIETVIEAVRVLVSGASEQEKRTLWMRYAQWLVAGLTFQLAADIIETSVSTSWDAVGKIAAVAIIRTFLNFFLERDMRELQGRKDSTAI